MSNTTFTRTKYYEKEWRDSPSRSRIFDHFGPTGSRLLDDPFFRRMPFSGSLESLRNVGVPPPPTTNNTRQNAATQESRQATFSSSATSGYQSSSDRKSEERSFADEKDRFIVTLDVSQFAPEEVRVKVADDMLIVEASHDEKKDEHGFVTRLLRRRYPLPKDVDAQNIVSELTKSGMLTVKAPKLDVHQKAKERQVPVQIVHGDHPFRTTGFSTKKI